MKLFAKGITFGQETNMHKIDTLLSTWPEVTSFPFDPLSGRGGTLTNLFSSFDKSSLLITFYPILWVFTLALLRSKIPKVKQFQIVLSFRCPSPVVAGKTPSQQLLPPSAG